MSDLPFGFPKTESRYLAKAREAACALRRRFGGGVPASDMVQQVIVEALSERLRTGTEPKGFWKRLVNKVFDNYRREQVHQRMIGRRADTLREAEWKGQGGRSGEDEAIGREVGEAIEQAVSELSENDREIWRRLGMSESNKEIAKALGKTPDAIKQAVYRIRMHVQGRLPTVYRKG